MRVTSKGKVTIAHDVRRRMGIEPGTEVAFRLNEDGGRLVRCPDHAGAALVASMRGRRLSMSTDEIMALTPGDELSEQE